MATASPLDPLVRTRLALHAVAEHVLAADLYHWNGRIGLRATPAGFGTPIVDSPDGSRRSRVEGNELVLEVGATRRRQPLTTLADAAAFLDVSPGAPGGLYVPVTALDLHAPLDVDRDAAVVLAKWFELADLALNRVAIEEDRAGAIQLWPEHFDLAMTVGEVNLGGSPGDAEHDEPYLYVGPWTVPDGPFWNEPFGASRARREVGSVSEAVDFLLRGLEEAGPRDA